jgi:formamidopyrimidine-DNA glycosylase
MPELPEVETVRRDLAPKLTGQVVGAVTIRFPRLRAIIDPALPKILPGQRVVGVSRRSKYLLLAMSGGGTLIFHLGMSGWLTVVDFDHPVRPNDHFDLALLNGSVLRLNDPRRFGAIIWTTGSPYAHPYLADLGPEPFDPWWTARRFQRVFGMRGPIKPNLMVGQNIVGVGNIYANESLHRSGIDPNRAGNSLTIEECQLLLRNIQLILRRAIGLGGTTLQDFYDPNGNPGGFTRELQVYDRAGLPCFRCQTLVVRSELGKRATFWCPSCQR